jgi:hypothetical protein
LAVSPDAFRWRHSIARGASTASVRRTRARRERERERERRTTSTSIATPRRAHSFNARVNSFIRRAR